MVEAQVKFLCSIASTLSNQDKIQTLLKSYYLMRCQDISRGIGLPDKHFSTITRCPHCCTEWKHATDSKIKVLKLSRNRIKKLKRDKKNEDLNKLLHSNQLESTCSFCKHKTVTPLVKPDRKQLKIAPTKIINIPAKNKEVITNKTNVTNKMKKIKKISKEQKNLKPINAYAKAKDIFSLKNNDNSIPKEEPKVIKNSKKKKDKFAGLCQQAVLSAAKQNKDKLSLFLKPSL